MHHLLAADSGGGVGACWQQQASCIASGHGKCLQAAVRACQAAAPADRHMSRGPLQELQQAAGVRQHLGRVVAGVALDEVRPALRRPLGVSVVKVVVVGSEGGVGCVLLVLHSKPRSQARTPAALVVCTRSHTWAPSSDKQRARCHAPIFKAQAAAQSPPLALQAHADSSASL